MASVKPVEEASQDFTADLAAMRDDVAKLSSSVSEFIRTQTAETTNTVVDAVDNARQKISVRRVKRKIVLPERARTLRQRSSAIPWWRCLSRWLLEGWLPAYL
jgi:hypothetical protein